MYLRIVEIDTISYSGRSFGNNLGSIYMIFFNSGSSGIANQYEYKPRYWVLKNRKIGRKRKCQRNFIRFLIKFHVNQFSNQ